MKTKTFLLFLIFSTTFLWAKAQNQIVEAEYYLDQDPGFGNATPIDFASGENISEAFNAALGNLTAGTYFAYVRVKDENDRWSIPFKVPFNVQKADLPDITAAEWYIGEDPGFGFGNSLDIEVGQVTEGGATASTDGLPAGRNFAYLRFQNANGTWSVPLKKAFLVNDKVPLDAVAAEYFVDEDPGFGMGIPVSVDPDHFIEDSYLAEVSPDLELGDHFLYTRVQNEEGDWSVNVVRTFTVGAVSTEDQVLLQSTAVFPIPTKDFITIRNDALSIRQVRLFDMTGRAVDASQLNESKLDLSSFASGTYLLRISMDAGSVTRKIVVE